MATLPQKPIPHFTVAAFQIYLTQNRHIQDIVDRYYNDDDNFPSTEYRLHWALTYKDEDGQEVNIDENSLQNYYGRDDCDLLYDNEDQARKSIEDFKAGHEYFR